MDLQTALTRLQRRENIYFDFTTTGVTDYAAIIKHKKRDGYYIEIGLVDGERIPTERVINNYGIKDNFIYLYPTDIDDESRNEIKNGDLIIRPLEEHSYMQQCVKKDESVEIVPLLQAGVSIASNNNKSSSGTAGMFFHMNDKTDDIYLLSNFHVIGNGVSTKIGVDKVTHPKTKIREEDYKIIGELFWVNPQLDAAVAKVTNYPVKKKSYSRCKEIAIKKISLPYIGQRVIKCGKSTGNTCGIIRSVNCTFRARNRTGSYDIRIRNQILTTCMSLDGDSGSILISEKGDILGLLIGGNGINASFYVKVEDIFNSQPSHFKNQELPNISFKEGY